MHSLFLCSLGSCDSFLSSFHLPIQYMNWRFTSLVFIFFLSASVLALDVKAPERVPENGVWGFTVDIGLLDSALIVDVIYKDHLVLTYSNSNVIDPMESTSLVAWRKAGNTISASMLGESAGSYKLIVHTRLSGGQIIETKEKTISFVSVLDSANLEQIQNDLNTARKTIEELKTQNQSLTTALSDQNNQNSTQSQQLSVQSQKLDTVESALISLQQALGAFSDFDSQTAKKISSLQTDLDETNAKIDAVKPVNTGFFGLADSGNLWMILLVVGIIAIGYFAWQYKQQNP